MVVPLLSPGIRVIDAGCQASFYVFVGDANLVHAMPTSQEHCQVNNLCLHCSRYKDCIVSSPCVCSQCCSCVPKPVLRSLLLLLECVYLQVLATCPALYWYCAIPDIAVNQGFKKTKQRLSHYFFSLKHSHIVNLNFFSDHLHAQGLCLSCSSTLV